MKDIDTYHELTFGVWEDHARGVVDERLVRLREIAEARHALDVAEADLLAQDATETATEIECGATATAFWAGLNRVAPGVARTRVHAARMLNQWWCRSLADALRAGQVSWSHVETIYRVANPRNEGLLEGFLPAMIELAAHTTLTRWQREVRGIADRLDIDGKPPAETRPNTLSIMPNYDGSLDLRGTLSGQLAIEFSAAIAAETMRIYRQCEHDTTHVGGWIMTVHECQAEALLNLVLRGIDRPNADVGSVRPEVLITYNTTTGQLTDERSLPVPRDAVWWLLASGRFTAVELDADNNVLKLGRARRFATSTQRKAIHLRDGGCVFPGCNAPSGTCDIHHVTEWLHGGATDVDEMASMCRHHHRVTHRPGWSMSKAPPGGRTRFQWITPTGNIISSQHRPRI